MRVITYTDPRKLASHKAWNLIKSTPHLCATQSLSDGVKHRYQNAKAPSRYIAAPVLPIRKLFELMLPGWFADLTQVRQYSEVTRALTWLKKQKKPEWGDRLEAFERNQQVLLNSVRTLAEGGLHPSHLPAGTPDEEIFRQLWTRLEQKDRDLKGLRTELFGRLEDREVFRKRLRKALQDLAGEGVTLPPIKQLVLHGFYFITPLQRRMADLMERAGIELVFLNCYDPRYERVFETWNAFFPDRSVWEVERSTATLPPVASHFAGLIAGTARGKVPGGQAISLVRYPDTSALLDEIRYQYDAGELPELYSPLAKDLNGLLRDFYPERYQRRHFLAYPAGRFLYELHQMWHEPSGELRLTPDGLMECLSSGLLQAGRLHGQDFTLALRRVLPVLEGLDRHRGREQWLERLDWLCSVVEDDAPEWETPADPSASDYPVHALLHNPFQRIGYTSITADEARALRVLTEQLFDIADELFSDADVPIYEHLERIDNLMQAGVDPSRLEAEEQELLDKLKAHLDSARDDGTALPRKDLSAALQFFLGGVTKEEDEEMVGGLDRLDGAVLAHPKGHLHLCLLAEGALPARGGALPWPVTEASLKQIRSTSVCADLLLTRREQAANASLYLFFYALAFGHKVTLSWVADWLGDQVEESLYLLLLEDAGLQVEAPKPPSWGSTAGPDDLDPLDGEPEEIPAAALTQHAAAEYTLCPLRWFYSYGASPGPVYESAFHHQFLFSAMVQRLMQRSPVARRMKQPAAVKVASYYFPHLSAARKRDIEERYAFKFWPDEDWISGKPYNVVYRKLLVAGIGANKLGKALEIFTNKDRYDEVYDVMDFQDGRLPEAEAGHHCRFCPHSFHCPKAHFAVDDDR